MTPASTPNTELALEFARAMVAGDTARAHGLLSAPLQATLTVDQLAADYANMVADGDGPAQVIQAMTMLSDWPDKQPDDIEWIYVAIANDMYSEAVTVVVAQEGSKLVIRSVEWGRP